MTPRVFGCICFSQDLSSGLDKLSPRSIKCVFVRYSRTQGYRCYNLSTRKYLVSADITFFESVLYFSPEVHVTIFKTIPPSLSAYTFYCFFTSTTSRNSGPPATKPVRNFRYVYTYRLKVPVTVLIPANPSPVDDHPPPPSASPSDLDILIALRKGKQSYTDHPFSIFVSYEHLKPYFSSVCPLFVF